MNLFRCGTKIDWEIVYWRNTLWQKLMSTEAKFLELGLGYISHIYWQSSSAPLLSSRQIVCLFGVLRPTREFFHSYRDLNITGEGLQILTYARHSWPLSSEGYLACHTYCDTGHPFIKVISEDRDTHTYCRAFRSGAVTTCFHDLGLWRLGFERPTFRMRG